MPNCKFCGVTIGNAILLSAGNRYKRETAEE